MYFFLFYFLFVIVLGRDVFAVVVVVGFLHTQRAQFLTGSLHPAKSRNCTKYVQNFYDWPRLNGGRNDSPAMVCVSVCAFVWQTRYGTTSASCRSAHSAKL